MVPGNDMKWILYFNIITDALGTRTNIYDAVGRFSSIQWEVDGMSPVQAAYSYLPDSRLLSGWTISGNALSNALQVSRTYEPYRDLLLTVSNQAGNSLISSFQYQNDAIGRRTMRIDDNTKTNSFGYNVRSELTGAQMDTNQFVYFYDDIGNRKEASANEVTNLYTANELNQYVDIDEVEPSYDEDGNLIQAARQRYEWDAENRLIYVAPAGAAINPMRLYFTYDYMGRMVQRHYERHLRPNTRDIRQYLYGGWNRIQEVQQLGFGEDVTIKTNLYIWGLDLSGTLQGAGGVGGLLAEITSAGLRYPFCDGNGNITDWVDGSGVVVAHHEYDPYGNETSGNEPISFGFSSKPLEPNLGFYYYGYRFYSPEMGRWLNRDPIHEMRYKPYRNTFFSSLLWDLYADVLSKMNEAESDYIFVRNNVFARIDKLGLQSNPTTCEDWVDRQKSLPEITQLINDGCLSDIKCCCGGRFPNMFFYMTKEICIDKMDPRGKGENLVHELQHAADLCDIEGCPDCDKCIESELRARYCDGSDLNDGINNANISCREPCPDRNSPAICSTEDLDRWREPSDGHWNTKFRNMWKSFTHEVCLFGKRGPIP